MKVFPQEFLHFIPLAKFLFLKGVEIGLFIFLVEISVFIFQAHSPGSEKAKPQGWFTVAMEKRSLQTLAPWMSRQQGAVHVAVFFAPPLLVGV